MIQTRIYNILISPVCVLTTLSYYLDLQANKITYDGAVKAAAHGCDASFEVARLRTLLSVASAVGHNIARDLEQWLALRY